MKSAPALATLALHNLDEGERVSDLLTPYEFIWFYPVFRSTTAFDDISECFPRYQRNSFLLSFVPFFLRISGAGVRRMRRMTGAVWLVHSWKFSSWRRDALEGALVRPTSIPGRTNFSQSRGAEKKGAGEAKARTREIVSPLLFGNNACDFDRERCYNATDTHREVIMAPLLSEPFWSVKSIATAWGYTARHVFSIVAAKQYAHRARRAAFCRKRKAMQFAAEDAC